MYDKKAKQKQEMKRGRDTRLCPSATPAGNSTAPVASPQRQQSGHYPQAGYQIGRERSPRSSVVSQCPSVPSLSSIAGPIGPYVNMSTCHTGPGVGPSGAIRLLSSVKQTRRHIESVQNEEENGAACLQSTVRQKVSWRPIFFVSGTGTSPAP